MNYNADKPIETEAEDLLGRSFFSKQLAKALYECDARDGLVVGLFGKWGSGKTSVINMTMNEVKKLGRNDEKKPVIMKFSPWNYSDMNNLISLFFHSLIYSLDIPENDTVKEKIGKVLKDYADCLDVLSWVLPLGGSVANILKPIAKAKGADLMEVPNLESRKEKLENTLRDIDQKLIVVIDDIDRLTNSQIRDIFHLAKQVGNFPNIVYILSMDREIVCRALQEIHNIDGNKYLEKIIQVPFEIPQISKGKIQDYLLNQLNQIISEIAGEVKVDRRYWDKVFINCIMPYLDNLRDVNRLINVFRFKYEALNKEISIEDIVGITTLEVLEPKLYKWIYNHKYILCNSRGHKIFRNNTIRVEYRERFYDEFKAMDIDPDKSIRCISTMFSAFAEIINEYQGVYQSLVDSKKKMRICDDEKFDIYFRYDLDSIELYESIIKECLFTFNEEELGAVIEEINRNGNSIYFLEELLHLIGAIPYQRVVLITHVILFSQWNFKGEVNAGLFTRTAYDIAVDLVEALLDRVKTEQERFDLLNSMLEDMDKNRVGAIAIIICRIKLFYEENQGRMDINGLISLDHLQVLEKLYTLNIRAVIETEVISNIECFNVVIQLWKKLNKEETLDYFNKIAENNINMLKFVCALAKRWHSTNGARWGFEDSEYEEYIPKDEVYNEIKKLNKSDLSEFTDVEKIKLATFILNYQMNDIYPANEEKAQGLIEQWERNGIIVEN